MADKTIGEKLKEELFLKKENGLKNITDEKWAEISDFCEGYKSFLNKAKTEREAVDGAIKLAESNGFSEFDPTKDYTSGDKVYFNNRSKTVAFAVIGKDAVENGVNITAAHIDSPRLDLKPNPLYEEIELALFKTHYYGGIKKYQWTAVPLALHGVIVKANATYVLSYVEFSY